MEEQNIDQPPQDEQNESVDTSKQQDLDEFWRKIQRLMDDHDLYFLRWKYDNRNGFVKTGRLIILKGCKPCLCDDDGAPLEGRTEKQQARHKAPSYSWSSLWRAIGLPTSGGPNQEYLFFDIPSKSWMSLCQLRIDMGRRDPPSDVWYFFFRHQMGEGKCSRNSKIRQKPQQHLHLNRWNASANWSRFIFSICCTFVGCVLTEPYDRLPTRRLRPCENSLALFVRD